MKQIKHKKKIYGILAMLLMVGGLAGAMLFWTPGISPDNAQVSQETKTTSEAVETPTTGAEQKRLNAKPCGILDFAHTTHGLNP